MILYLCNVHNVQGEKKEMKLIYNFVVRLGRDNRGQDLIEYALMAGFVAVAAGAIMPGVAGQLSTIFSKVSSSLSSRAASLARRLQVLFKILMR
jgi:pilus assembly protein Flp/PilA